MKGGGAKNVPGLLAAEQPAVEGVYLLGLVWSPSVCCFGAINNYVLRFKCLAFYYLTNYDKVREPSTLMTLSQKTSFVL